MNFSRRPALCSCPSYSSTTTGSHCYCGQGNWKSQERVWGKAGWDEVILWSRTYVQTEASRRNGTTTKWFNNKVHNVEEQYSGKTALTSVTPGGMGTGGQQEEGAIGMIASANEMVSIYSYLWGLPNSGAAVVWFTVDRNVMSWLIVVTMLVQELMTITLHHLVHWLKNNTMFLDACTFICLIMWF